MTNFEREVIEKLTQLQADVDHIKSDLKEDYRVLYGNGQPGLISRVRDLEANWRWIKWVAGAIAAGVGFLTNIIAHHWKGMA